MEYNYFILLVCGVVGGENCLIKELIPKEYIINANCINLLKKQLCDYILPRTKNHMEAGFEIWIHDNYFRIKYKQHIYKVTIVKDETNTYFWFLRPYLKTHLLLRVIIEDSFGYILLAINKHHNDTYEEREQNG